jgi:hypothetical protein
VNSPSSGEGVMAGYSIINYKDKKIYYFDHTGLPERELIDNINAGIKMILETYDGEPILNLSNWTNTFGTNEVMDALKTDQQKDIYKKCKKIAVVGISGIKKILLNAINPLTGGKTRAFNTLEEAKEWLVAD